MMVPSLTPGQRWRRRRWRRLWLVVLRDDGLALHLLLRLRMLGMRRGVRLQYHRVVALLLHEKALHRGLRVEA